MLFGFIYVAMGMVLALEHQKGKEENLDKINKARISIAVILCAACVVAEWYLRIAYFGNARGCDITLALVPVTFVGEQLI